MGRGWGREMVRDGETVGSLVFVITVRYWKQCTRIRGISPSTLRVDGRMTENEVFMQLQADIVGLDVGEQPCDTV